MATETFRSLEYEAWSSKASAYDDWFAPITRQAIPPMLAALAPDLADRDLLDVCTGTGHLAGAAAARGARVEGVDFAEAMVALATARYPRVVFRHGDAQRLPYQAGAFHYVVNAFGLWHLEDPVAAFAEAFRVTRPGGRFAFSTWLSPERGFELWQLVLPAVRDHGTLDVPLPPSPPPFRFADPEECRQVLGRLGFDDVRVAEHTCSWEGRDGRQLLELIYRSIVRAPLLIERQAPEARERIKEAIVDRAEAFRRGDGIALRFPYLLVSAMRPA